MRASVSCASESVRRRSSANRLPHRSRARIGIGLAIEQREQDRQRELQVGRTRELGNDRADLVRRTALAFKRAPEPHDGMRFGGHDANRDVHGTEQMFALWGGEVRELPCGSGAGQPRGAWLALLAVKPKTARPGGR